MPRTDGVGDSPYRLQYFVIFSLFLYRLNDCLAKLLVTDLGSFELLFFRSFFSLILLPIFLFFAPFNYKSFFERSMLIRNVLGSLALILEVASLAYLSLSTFMLLLYTAPLFMKIFARIFLKEDLSLLELGVMGLSFIGVLCIVDFSLENNEFIGVIYAVSGVICYALTLVVTKTLKTRDPNSMYFNYIIMLFFVSALKLPEHIPGSGELMMLFAMAVIHIGAFYYFIKGFMNLKTSRAAVLEYLGLIFAIIFDYLIWGQLLSPLQLLGGTLIVGGSLISIYREQFFSLVRKKANLQESASIEE